MLTLLAHAAPISYKFPLPIWLYVPEGGAAVLVSAPVAAIAVSTGAVREWRGTDLYPGAALAQQAPLVGLMVLYTVAGLWVLAQQIKA